MPEVGIGFFPDVGATWFLPRLPGEIGTYCALTGERLKAADALAAGIATSRVASARFAELVEALCGGDSVDAILAAFAEPAEREQAPGPVMAHRGAIDRIFAAGSVEEILARLDAEATAESGARWAGDVAAAIRTKAPLSLKIALAQMRGGRNWSFEECMRAEFRVVSRVAYGHDFYEGIRAVIIDKDNRPSWRPATLADAKVESVERHFAPLESELVLP
jgi:enoyl-CoA hydratase